MSVVTICYWTWTWYVLRSFIRPFVRSFAHFFPFIYLLIQVFLFSITHLERHCTFLVCLKAYQRGCVQVWFRYYTGCLWYSCNFAIRPPGQGKANTEIHCLLHTSSAYTKYCYVL